MPHFIKQFVNDESGATAVEYGLITMLISVAIITILGGVGSSLFTTFTAVNNGLAAH